MKKKKISLSLPDLQGFLVFHLQSKLLDYQVTHHLNKHLDWKLIRAENLAVKIDPDKNELEFSFFYYPAEVNQEIFLLSQIFSFEPLIRDYYLIVQGILSQRDQVSLLEIPTIIPEILSINQIHPSEEAIPKKRGGKSLEMFQYIILDLEHHLIRQRRENKQRFRPSFDDGM